MINRLVRQNLLRLLGNDKKLIASIEAIEIDGRSVFVQLSRADIAAKRYLKILIAVMRLGDYSALRIKAELVDQTLDTKFLMTQYPWLEKAIQRGGSYDQKQQRQNIELASAAFEAVIGLIPEFTVAIVDSNRKLLSIQNPQPPFTKEVLGRSIYEFLPRQIAAKLDCGIHQCLETSASVEMQTPHCRMRLARIPNTNLTIIVCRLMHCCTL